MEDSKQSTLDWIRGRMKSSAKPPASTPASLADGTPTKSGNKAEWTINDLKFALDLAKQAQDIAGIARFVKSAVALLSKIIDSYKELRNADEKCLLARRIANITSNICAIVLRLQETNHSDQIGRLEGDFLKYEGFMRSSQHFNDGFSQVRHTAPDKLNQELVLFNARIANNRLVQFCLNQTPDTQTQDKIHDIEYKPHRTIQGPIIIHGGTGGTGGGGGNTGGAGGTGGGPIVNVSMEKLEKWLQFPPDMKQKQHDTEQLHMEGTGQWFLEDKRFIEWEDNPGVLWVEGPSGAGKSVLR
ncbi:Pfs domain-containing protein [Mycena sanguinolenta]|uniref:Pfs domain-containing protein n=1 Tax=Mycena sanguinolenta TaxID=230812 RepID=A0A8H6XWH5_9AGAR|nr:Pfs domain-containing protein [Mycena sanguinolenta]